MKVGIGDMKDAEIMRGIATRIFKISRWFHSRNFTSSYRINKLRTQNFWKTTREDTESTDSVLLSNNIHLVMCLFKEVW